MHACLLVVQFSCASTLHDYKKKQTKKSVTKVCRRSLPANSESCCSDVDLPSLLYLVSSSSAVVYTFIFSKNTYTVIVQLRVQYLCNELRLLIFNYVVIIRLLCMTSLMVNIYSVYWTIVVSCHMVVLSDILNC